MPVRIRTREIRHRYGVSSQQIHWVPFTTYGVSSKQIHWVPFTTYGVSSKQIHWVPLTTYGVSSQQIHWVPLTTNSATTSRIPQKELFSINTSVTLNSGHDEQVFVNEITRHKRGAVFSKTISNKNAFQYRSQQ